MSNLLLSSVLQGCACLRVGRQAWEGRWAPIAAASVVFGFSVGCAGKQMHALLLRLGASWYGDDVQCYVV